MTRARRSARLTARRTRPHFFVLDKERKIRYIGAMDDNVMNEAKVKKNYLRDAVDALLAGKAPEVAETQAQGCGMKYKKTQQADIRPRRRVLVAAKSG